MNLYPAVVIDTVTDALFREKPQDKLPTVDRDPAVVRQKTDYALSYGATKAHKMWLARFSTTPSTRIIVVVNSVSSFQKYLTFFKDAKAQRKAHGECYYNPHECNSLRSRHWQMDPLNCPKNPSKISKKGSVRPIYSRKFTEGEEASADGKTA